MLQYKKPIERSEDIAFLHHIHSRFLFAALQLHIIHSLPADSRKFLHRYPNKYAIRLRFQLCRDNPASFLGDYAGIIRLRFLGTTPG